MKKIAVLGNGSWGTSISLVLREKNEVTLWGALKEELDQVVKDNENVKYLKGYKLDGIKIEHSIEEACKDKDFLVIAIPTKFLRSTLKIIGPHISPRSVAVCLSKGIEKDTYKLVTDIVEEELPGLRGVVALSGPSHAEEVAEKIPTAVVAACPDLALAAEVQTAFMSPYFRIYTNDDIRGTEIGGSVKNVIAIAAGISDGLGYGANTLSALMTRGLVEIVRFGVSMGAEPTTFYGLTGLGDLITTCTSTHSRNHYVGVELGKGRKWADIEKGMVMVAEGVQSVGAVYEYSKKHNIKMPLTEAVYKVIFENQDPRETVLDLMTREAKTE